MTAEKTGLRISGYRSIDPPSKTPIIVTLLLLALAGPAVTFYLTDKKYSARIEALQAEIRLKDSQPTGSAIRNTTLPKTLPLKSVILVPGVTPLDLQKTLRRAGVYAGPVDGLLTKNVVDSLKEFQRRRQIRADGVLGNRTWQLLRQFQS